jgi:hypothetical protein
MKRLVVLLLLMLIALALATVVAGLFVDETGVLEKAVLVVLAAGLVWAATRVRRMAY